MTYGSVVIDTGVARDVMGWTLFTSMGETWATTRPIHEEGIPEQQRSGDRLMYQGRKFGFFAPGWSPSSDYNDAMEVFHRVEREADWAAILSGIGAYTYTVGFMVDGAEYEGSNDELPKAICIAALNWADGKAREE